MKLLEKEKQAIVNQEMEELRLLIQEKKPSKAELKRWQKAGMKEILESLLKLFQ